MLDLHLCAELRLGVAAIADGTAALFDLDDGCFLAGIVLCQGAARSVAVVRHPGGADADAGPGRYSLLCGGADGAIHRVPLRVDPGTGRVDEDRPFAVDATSETALRPKHTGPVVSLAAPDDGSGLFVSGGQDGALRVWDCAAGGDGGGGDGTAGPAEEGGAATAKCLYALTGYKLWLGSACTDGKRLVSDGESGPVAECLGGRWPSVPARPHVAGPRVWQNHRQGGENSVIVRDFFREPETNGDSRPR